MEKIKYLLIFCIIYLIFREIYKYINKNTIEKYTEPPTSPILNSNLVLWLDSNDPYGNQSVPDRANNVVLNTWKDKSGKNNDAIKFGNPTIVDGGIEVGTGNLFNSRYVFSGNETAFVVLNTLIAGQFQLLRGQESTLNHMGFHYNNESGRYVRLIQN